MIHKTGGQLVQGRGRGEVTSCDIQVVEAAWETCQQNLQTSVGEIIMGQIEMLQFGSFHDATELKSVRLKQSLGQVASGHLQLCQIRSRFQQRTQGW